MDDQRDYEEEQAQEAALQQEQKDELDAAASEGLETLGDTDPVDSSSDDFQNADEIAATVDAEGGEAEGRSLTLAQVVAKEKLGFMEVWGEISDLCDFGSAVAAGMKEVYDRGLDSAPDDIELTVSSLESQALSIGLNIVTVMEPRLASYAESLLRRAAEAARGKELDEARREEIRRIATDLREEQEAELFGFDSLEEYREAKEHVEAQRAEAQRAEEAGAAHLN